MKAINLTLAILCGAQLARFPFDYTWSTVFIRLGLMAIVYLFCWAAFKQDKETDNE